MAFTQAAPRELEVCFCGRMEPDEAGHALQIMPKPKEVHS